MSLRNIVVIPYDPRWPALAADEIARLQALFGEECLTIHHIGSTAIPAMHAKPIIDLMPLVRNIERVDAFNGAMKALGYEACGENGLPGRRYFRKGGRVNRTHQVHTYAVGDPAVARHLAFRDYLIAHPEEAARYAALKIELARRFPHDIHGYMDGKDSFIKETERRALAWVGAR